MLVYSFSHLSLDPMKSGEFRTSYSVSNFKEQSSHPELSSRMMSVAGQSNNQIYKPVSVGGSEAEKRKMIENNMKECCVFLSVCFQHTLYAFSCVLIKFTKEDAT